MLLRLILILTTICCGVNANEAWFPPVTAVTIQVKLDGDLSPTTIEATASYDGNEDASKLLGLSVINSKSRFDLDEKVMLPIEAVCLRTLQVKAENDFDAAENGKGILLYISLIFDVHAKATGIIISEGSKVDFVFDKEKFIERIIRSKSQDGRIKEERLNIISGEVTSRIIGP